MNYNCRCCKEFMPSIPQWDNAIGCVCAECKGFLEIAELAFAEAGVVGCYLDKPQKQGGKP